MERKSFAQIGDYTFLENGKTVEEAKKELLERMMETIKDVAQDDRFWIVKEDSVGWKMAIPQWEIARKITVKNADGTVLKVIKFGGNE